MPQHAIPRVFYGSRVVNSFTNYAMCCHLDLLLL